MKNQGPIFCPVPVRAMSDPRLTAGHFRLLLAIASHDRFSKDRHSAGCYASQQTLAEETSLHLTNIGGYARDLEAWGYLEVEHHREDRRRLVYRVIYDAAIVGEPTNFRR
jgi:DNA-binding MarR family transcriptional regulator